MYLDNPDLDPTRRAGRAQGTSRFAVAPALYLEKQRRDRQRPRRRERRLTGAEIRAAIAGLRAIVSHLAFGLARRIGARNGKAQPSLDRQRR